MLELVLKQVMGQWWLLMTMTAVDRADVKGV
jgi:hypothetical protein